MGYTNKIAIVGAGFSGTMVAVQLLRQAKQPLTVYLIEANQRQVGRGVAYGTDQDCHLLNVPAANMSAFPDEPTHFFDWAKAKESELLKSNWVTEVIPASFLPRRVYGDYLVDVLDKARQFAPANNRLERKIDKVVKIIIQAGQVGLDLLSGGTLQVQKVVLAIGNFPPGDPWVKNSDFYQSGRYFSNPWQSGLLAKLLNTQSCLLVGSGLTMVDWAIALMEAGYQGQIHSISRRGLSPQAHRPCPKAEPSLAIATSRSVHSGLRQLRQLIRESGCDWRVVVDALRPASQTWWVSLPLLEQQRFLRHLRTYWDCHRHRLAPEIARRLDGIVGSGQLRQYVGRILEFHESSQGVEILIRKRGQAGLQTLNVDAVVNCSGSESDYRKLGCPLVKDLLDKQLARPDALALGLDVTGEGALIDGYGVASKQLFTLGPPQKGHFWETTAVPEIRGQAEKLAKTLLS